MPDATHRLNIIIQVMDKNMDKLDELNKKLKKTDDNLKAKSNILDGVTRRFNMNTLSFIFGGMMLERFASKSLGAFATSYFKVTEYQTELGKTVMGVQANFEFLKYSIFNALNQNDMIIGLINGFGSIIEKVSEFINLNPETSALIVGFMGFAWVLGGVGMAIGGIAQSQHLINLMGDLFTKTNDLLKIGGIAAFLNPWVILAVVLGLALYYLGKHPEALKELGVAFSEIKVPLTDFWNTFWDIPFVKPMVLGFITGFILGLY